MSSEESSRSSSSSSSSEGINESSVPFAVANQATSTQNNTFALVFLWTDLVPQSRQLAEALCGSASTNGVISSICVDSPLVRSYLCGKVDHAPCFVAMQNGNFSTFDACDVEHALGLVSRLTGGRHSHHRDYRGSNRASNSSTSIAV